MTDTSLDDILSGQPDVEQAPEPIETPAEAPAQSSIERDEHGRFAPKQEQAPQAEQQPPAETPAPAEPQTQQQRGVPPAALQAEREKRRERDAEIEALRAQMQQMERLIAAGQMARQPQPETPVTPPSLWDNPDEYMAHSVREAVSPIQQQLYYNARLVAEQVHGADTVQQAQGEFDRLGQTGQLDPADYRRVMQSPNPFDEAVKWFKRKTALDEIGTDPASYRERVKAEVLAEMQAAGQQPAAAQPGQPPVMPSNLAGARNMGARTGPAWSGPTPLADIFKR